MKIIEIFNIETKRTGYIIGVTESRHLCCLNYGRKLKKLPDDSVLFEKYDIGYGSMVAYSRQDANFGLDDVCLEFSAYGKGDFREPTVELICKDGVGTADLKYVGVRTFRGKEPIPGLPSSYDENENCVSHIIELFDEVLNVTVYLHYCAFYDSDVITRHIEIKNGSASPITLRRAMSMQLYLPESDYYFVTFDGTWAYERERNDKKLSPGIYINDSKTGVSSARHNPFVTLRRDNCDEDSGECYGFNLVYSGNHAEVAEVTHSGKTRILCGINPFGFEYELPPDQTFHTPEAVMTFSSEGLNGLSRNMHDFVNSHIIRGKWKSRPRPVLVNNWEGTWFDFDENKILNIAKVAAELGIELFVLDDGWFGERSSDDRSLGDWVVNKKKLPHSISGLASRIKELGMDFGIWVEPEMVNENSELYRAHPDWAVRLPSREPSLGRSQLILDLTQKQVRDYIVSAMTRIFSTKGIAYVKWDMNRNFSDAYSPSLPPRRQGEFFHRYVLGLYEILETLTNSFPDILFESCASGGNRFDLGMLCYMPQIWTSDNTDPISRLTIQNGTSYGYPLSCMGAHVSASPHQQTLRNTPIETRFNTAAFGCLGYEMDMTKLTPFDKKCIKAQVEFYKEHRTLFQYGTFYRVKTPYVSDTCVWCTVSKDKTEAAAGFFQTRAVPTHTHDILRLNGLSDDLLYEIEGRKQYICLKTFGDLVNHVLPVKIRGDGVIHTLISARYMFKETPERYLAYGDTIKYAGIRLKQQFGGTGYNDDIRVLGDFGSVMYYIKSVPDDSE
jgi:alpha-galactosidase